MKEVDLLSLFLSFEVGARDGSHSSHVGSDERPSQRFITEARQMRYIARDRVEHAIVRDSYLLIPREVRHELFSTFCPIGRRDIVLNISAWSSSDTLHGM